MVKTSDRGENRGEGRESGRRGGERKQTGEQERRGERKMEMVKGRMEVIRKRGEKEGTEDKSRRERKSKIRKW